MTSVNEALILVFVMGAVIIFCRAFPFLFFGAKEKGKTKLFKWTAILDFVEKTVPPVAMTVLAFNALGGAFKGNAGDGLLVLAASMVTALVHLWKRNALISIFGGTALYMVLTRIFL